LSEGWAHPLKGFMREDDYLQCLHFNTIKRDGNIYNQSIPIVLSCSNKDRELLADKTKLCLSYNEKPVAILNNISIYVHRKEERCARQFGLNNTEHPYQKYIYEECGNWLIGGDLEVLERIKWNDGLDQYRYTPLELREKFKEMNVYLIFFKL
jgi:3'-phosphoadenosine 5'-phosphosulfate synthase